MIDELDFSMPVLSISESIFNENMSIYPNPTSGVINLDFGNIKNIDLKVFNILGETVYQRKNITNTLYQFTLNQPSGIYFIQVNSQGKQHQIKLVKK